MALPKPTTMSPRPPRADAAGHAPGRDGGVAALRRYLPFLDWLVRYDRANLVGDLMAGLVVAIMLVPQAMAYAMLAGLPPEVGLYASIVPIVLYALLGSSRTLAVGPVAIMSLLTATSVGALAEQGTPEYLTLALVLALLVGITQVAMGLARIGFIVNFLGHPVISGFTSAAALIIGASQLKHLLGVSIPNSDYFHETVIELARVAGETNRVTLAIGAVAIAILVYFKRVLGGQLTRAGVPAAVVGPVTKAGPLVIVALGTLVVAAFGLDSSQGIKVVGDIPAGLPSPTAPSFDWDTWRQLLPAAITISFVGFMESISVAKSLASKRRQKVDANQELIGLGAANLGAAFTGGYPVTGGFSRSVVNFTAGANTQLASILTAGLIALTVLLLTPVFYYLPQAVLAAIVIVAVAALVDTTTVREVWAYNKADFAALAITFVAVLTRGVEVGILAGAGAAIALYLWRTSRPHVAVVGQVPGSETYRNVRRHTVLTCPEVVALRVDESLYFANTRYLEDTVLRTLAEQPEARHLVLIGSAINEIDASALETLASLARELRDMGVELHLAEMKGPVMDRLQRTHLLHDLGPGHVHPTTHAAMRAAGCGVSGL